MKNKSGTDYSGFHIIWLGQLVSLIGTGLTIFSLGVYVYQKTNAASSYVLILLCFFLPPFLLKPWGGILADRYDRRTMMIIGDLGSSLGLLFIFIIMLKGNIELWQIYAGIAVSSVFGAFQEPAYQALITDLLPEELYARGSGLVQLAHSAQYLISPFMAGMLMSVMDIEYIFLIDISTLFFASGVVLWTRKTSGAPVPKNGGRNFLAEFREGFRSFSANRGVVNLVVTIMVVLFFVGLLQSLLIPMLLDLVPAKTAGISQSVCASGMLLGSLFLGIFGGIKGLVKTLSVSLFASGLFFAGLGLFTGIVLISLSGFLFFGSLPFINMPIEVLVRKNIDNETQGRVWSIISMVSYLGSLMAFALAGFLADRVFNPLLEPGGSLADNIGLLIGTGKGRGIALIFIISGVMISFVALVIRANRKIRQLEEGEIFSNRRIFHG